MALINFAYPRLRKIEICKFEKGRWAINLSPYWFCVQISQNIFSVQPIVALASHIYSKGPLQYLTIKRILLKVCLTKTANHIIPSHLLLWRRKIICTSSTTFVKLENWNFSERFATYLVDIVKSWPVKRMVMEKEIQPNSVSDSYRSKASHIKKCSSDRIRLKIESNETKNSSDYQYLVVKARLPS